MSVVACGDLIFGKLRLSTISKSVVSLNRVFTLHFGDVVSVLFLGRMLRKGRFEVRTVHLNLTVIFALFVQQMVFLLNWFDLGVGVDRSGVD